MSAIRPWLGRVRRARLHRFVLVGLLNTLAGYSLILAFQVISHNPVLSNLLGYTFGAGFSYLTHSHLTFGHAPSSRSAGAYLVVLLVSYALNVVVLKLSLLWLPAAAAQGVAVLSFAVFSYVGQAWLVFPKSRRNQIGRAHV